MPLPIIPIVLGTTVAVAAYRKFRKPHGMTPERKKVFEAAMKTLRDPLKLRQLADAFEKEGLKAEANELRKRAAIFSAPPKVLESRKAVFKQAMNSTKPEAIKKVAREFHKVGHYESAAKLRKYASGLAAISPKGGVAAKLRIGEEEFAEEDVPQSAAEV